MEAERVIVELLARVEGFDAKIKQSAAAFEGSMKRVEGAASKGEAAVGRSFAGAAQAQKMFARQLNDVSGLLQGSNSPFAIVTKNAPISAKAFGFVTAGASALGGVLGGVVVTSAFAAAEALIKMALSGDEAAEAVASLVEKLKESAEKADLARRAEEAFGRTAEGAALSLNKITEALDKQNLSLEDNIALTRRKIQQDLQVVRQGIATGERDLSQAQADLRAAQAAQQAGAAAGSEGAAGDGLRRAKQRVEELSKSLARLRAAAAGGERSLFTVDLPLLERTAEAAVDPIKKIGLTYDSMRHAAEKAAAANKALRAGLQGVLIQIEKNRAAALQTEQARTNGSRGSSGLTGNHVDFAGARAIAERAGFQVNSAQRTYAQQAALYNDPSVNRPGNPVARPGTSAHEGAKGKWALDIQFAPGLTANKIKKTFADEGVSLTAVYKEKGHFHAEGRAPGASGPSADTLARRAEAAIEKEENRRAREANVLAGLNERYAAALAALADGTEQSAEARKAAINLERDNEDAKIAANRDLNATAKVEAKRLNDATAELAKQLIDRADAEKAFRAAEEKRQRDLTVAEALNQNQQDVLHSQEGLARTQAERRDIELRILALAFEEERLRAQAVIAARDALAAELEKKGVDKLTAEDKRNLADANASAVVAQNKLDTLPERQANATAGVLQNTAGPLQQLFDQMPQTAAEVSEAFETIAANGLNSLVDGITDAITGAKSFGEAFRGIAQQIIRDIIMMTVRMLIFKAISAATGIPIGGFSEGGVVKAAGGGFIRGPGTGTSDSIPAMLSDGEFVIRKKSVDRIGVPLLEHLNAGGALPAFSSGGLVRIPRPSNAPALSSQRGGFSQGDINSLRGIVGEAVNAGVGAMPDVNLFASLDPADVLQRALGSPAGEKALIAALGRNSGRVRATIGQ